MPIYEFNLNKRYQIVAKNKEDAFLKFFQMHNCKQEFLDNLECTNIITLTNEEE